MPKTTQTPSLNLDGAQSITSSDNYGTLSPSTMSPTSPRSPRSPPGHPSAEPEFTIRPVAGQEKTSSDYTSNSDTQRGSTEEAVNSPQSPTITAIPQYPPSPKTSPRHARDPSKSFFSNLMASKSSHRLNSPDRTEERPVEKSTKSRGNSRERGLYTRHARGSTTDLSKIIQEPDAPDRSRSQSVAQISSAEPSMPPSSANRRGGKKFGGLLQRTRSIRVEDTPKRKASPPQKLNLQRQDSGLNSEYQEPPKTAPPKPIPRIERNKQFKEAVNPPNPSSRTRSADRQETDASRRRDKQPSNLSSSFREGTGTSLLSNLSQTGRGAANRLGQAGKGLFGKINRSGSTNERELVTDDNYQCSTINMPLVEQTRKTRIARRLELSKDKTEFWMPALPWRCIDYLNMNGCEEEGLYRVPGSGREVKHYQRRFDAEHDINLFDEPELYDINTIGSLFKAWLRDLPDEILPKATQAKIARECHDATKTPQLLKDELSKLPPFKYYLLFAITCHLSLLNSFSDKNKMTFSNLVICFQPCLKVDAFCFQFLVQDWKNCWQGCWTEKEYLEEEYRILESVEQGEMLGSENHSADERAVSSSDSGGQQQQGQHHGLDFTDRAGSPVKTTHHATSNNNTNGGGGSGGVRRVTKPAPLPTATQSQQLLPEVQIGAPLSPISIP